MIDMRIKIYGIRYQFDKNTTLISFVKLYFNILKTYQEDR